MKKIIKFLTTLQGDKTFKQLSSNFFMSTFSRVLTFVASQKQENHQTVLYSDYVTDNKWLIFVFASRNIVELYKTRKIHKATVHLKVPQPFFSRENCLLFLWVFTHMLTMRAKGWNGRETVCNKKLFDEQIIDGKVGRTTATENAVREQILISLVEKKSFNSTENNFIVAETS